MMADQIKIIYIAGTGHSGSTLLANLLGQMDGICSVGEIIDIWRGLVTEMRCGCRSVPYRECSFWADVFERAFGGFDQIDARALWQQAKLVRAMTARHINRAWADSAPLSQSYLNAVQSLYHAIAAASNSSIIVDSSKSFQYAYLLNRLPTIDLTIVHLVRDPRAIAHSNMRKTRTRDQSGPSASAQGRQWLMGNLLWNALMPRFMPGVTYLRVLYEDLMAHPRHIVENITSTLDQTFEPPAIEDYVVRLKPTHTVSGNQTRHRRGKINLRPDMEWISRLGRFSQYVVTAISLPLMISYGYPILAPARRYKNLISRYLADPS